MYVSLAGTKYIDNDAMEEKQFQERQKNFQQEMNDFLKGEGIWKN